MSFPADFPYRHSRLDVCPDPIWVKTRACWGVHAHETKTVTAVPGSLVHHTLPQMHVFLARDTKEVCGFICQVPVGNLSEKAIVMTRTSRDTPGGGNLRVTYSLPRLEDAFRTVVPTTMRRLLLAVLRCASDPKVLRIAFCSDPRDFDITRPPPVDNVLQNWDAVFARARTFIAASQSSHSAVRLASNTEAANTCHLVLLAAAITVFEDRPTANVTEPTDMPQRARWALDLIHRVRTQQDLDPVVYFCEREYTECKHLKKKDVPAWYSTTNAAAFKAHTAFVQIPLELIAFVPKIQWNKTPRVVWTRGVGVVPLYDAVLMMRTHMRRDLMARFIKIYLNADARKAVVAAIVDQTEMELCLLPRLIPSCPARGPGCDDASRYASPARIMAVLPPCYTAFSDTFRGVPVKGRAYPDHTARHMLCNLMMGFCVSLVEWKDYTDTTLSKASTAKKRPGVIAYDKDAAKGVTADYAAQYRRSKKINILPCGYIGKIEGACPYLHMHVPDRPCCKELEPGVVPSPHAVVASRLF